MFEFNRGFIKNLFARQFGSGAGLTGRGGRTAFIALCGLALFSLACQPQGQITVSQEELRAIVQDEVDAQLSNPSEVVLARLDTRLSETDGYMFRPAIRRLTLS